MDSQGNLAGSLGSQVLELEQNVQQGMGSAGSVNTQVAELENNYLNAYTQVNNIIPGFN